MKDLQHEILLVLQEECAEVIQAISKQFRFGADSTFNGKSNQLRLEEELGDLLQMVELLLDQEMIDIDSVHVAMAKKKAALGIWSTHIKGIL
jgi:NTP pyrophosphatase (non-canonical NTP hydrolase)